MSKNNRLGLALLLFAIGWSVMGLFVTHTDADVMTILVIKLCLFVGAWLVASGSDD